MYRYLGIYIFLWLSSTAFAGCPKSFSVGPEIYYLKRSRDGGTCQNGRIDGIYLRYDRICGYSFYLGADYLHAMGKVKGETGTGRRIVSDLTDSIFEMRLGYTLLQHPPACTFITPFVGWGCFEEENIFYPPTPRPCTFTDTFNYLVVGFLSGVNFTPLISMGIYFKVKFLQDGESKVTDDPWFEDVTLMMKDEIQVRLDVPISFSPCNTLCGIGFQLTPFYEYRHFGGREGYPFNFKDTQFQIFGARFAITHGF